MVPEHVIDKLQYFDEDKYKICSEETILEEKKKLGEAVLKCTLDKDTLIFHKAEENTLTYLDGNKKRAKASPDVFLFELVEDGQWVLHIIEFKKTIKTSTIDNSKIQFIMGIYNARAVAGFLKIRIKQIYVYSAYRADKISDIDKDSLIQMRSANSNSKDLATIREWKNGKCTLKIDLEEVVFKHIKIQLDENGYGECSLHKM